MIGAGTKDLAQGLSRIATHFAGSATQGVWILGGEGELLAAGGAHASDGDPSFAVDGELRVGGLAPGRRAQYRRLDAERNGPWLVVTDDAGAAPEATASLLNMIGQALERQGRRDYENEDTTEHLLSCFEQIRAVHDLADRLPVCETVDEMSKLCLESLLLALGVRVGSIILREDGRETARAVFMGEEGQSVWTTDVVIGGRRAAGPVAEALRDGRVRYGNADMFEIPPGTIEAEARESLLLVPICFGAEPNVTVLGCILLIDRAGAHVAHGSAFGNPEAELTQSVSTLLGLALGTRMRASAEKELQIARSIQETLIPEQAPSWQGYDLAGRNHAANQVGGDYFDFLESADGRQHVVIADVSGHNMASAMAMVMARSQLKAVLSQESEPASILQALAAGLFEDLVRNELFITVFMLTFVEQTRSGTLVRFTNGGHNPPLLLRADGSVEWLDGGGPMVGFVPSVDYEEHELVLQPGDVLVLYTDGVTEVTDEAGRMLDEAGLARVVRELAGSSSSEILDGVFSAVDAHAASVAEDDVTAVVIKVVEPRVQRVDREPELSPGEAL